MMTKQEESAIIRRVLDGDANQFEALVKAYEKPVYNLALRILSDPQDALDASQEAFFRAYQALPRFRGDSRFYVWLYRLVSNVCTDMLRRRGREESVSLTDEEGQEREIPDERGSPQRLLEQKELRAALRRAVARLEPAFRETLLLREIGGLSYEEIARVTGQEAGTVKSRIFRARRKLAAVLSADGNFFGSGSSDIVDKTKAKGGRTDE